MKMSPDQSDRQKLLPTLENLKNASTRNPFAVLRDGEELNYSKISMTFELKGIRNSHGELNTLPKRIKV